MRARPRLASLVLVLCLAQPGLAGALAPSLRRCERAAAAALVACTRTVNARARSCYRTRGRECGAADRPIARAAARLEIAQCADPATVAGLGYGPGMSPAALATRLAAACIGEAASLAARTFGGPQGVLLSTADRTTRACLASAHRQGAKLIERAFRLQSACVRRAHAGRTCNVGRRTARLAAVEAGAGAGIERTCASLGDVIGMDIPAFLARAAAQARCMVATAHGDVYPLALDCGPRASLPVPPRGQWVQVVLDEATWGTRCGDGSPYAVWLRLAPAGAPLERVIVDVEAGGFCISESDCARLPPGIFEALHEYQPSGPSGGYLSTDPATNPFADWTMMALPYCTQDLHIGGGATSAFPSITVHRFGALNLRAGLRYLRDVLWAALDATSQEGYRPDRLRVIFGGVSAGGFGVAYNYHYVLDDLRWSHATAVPDSALGLDNGGTIGVRDLVPADEPPPLGWAARPYQAPYCLSRDCAVVPRLLAATAARLKAVPEQQVLNVSSQLDVLQANTTFFPSLPSWTNAVRAAYCANRGLEGLHYWLPATSSPIHGWLLMTDRFTTIDSAGTTLAAWLSGAMAAPDALVDRVEEGTLADDPAIDPFPCAPLSS